MTLYCKLHVAASLLLCAALFGLTTAYAGEYHAIKEKTSRPTVAAAESLACSQCHTMHGSQGGYSLMYGQSAVLASGATVNPKLLRHATILQLCLYCHDGNNAGLSPPPPDVYGVNFATGQANPSAGSLCAVTGQDGVNPPCSSTTISHTVGAAGPINIPGSNPVKTLTEFTCVNCHNPHGTTSYRNLRDNGTTYPVVGGITFMAAGETVTYSMGTTRVTTVHVNNLVNAGLGVTKYETSNVVFKLVPTINTRGIQGFCRSCHTDFHGIPGATNMSSNAGVNGDAPATPNPWLRHPTTVINMTTGAANLHVDSNCWTTGTAAGGCAETFTTWNRAIDPAVASENTATAAPFCLSCHRAHGSTNHSNLIFGQPTTVGGAGTMMRSTCQQCHNQ